MTDKKILYVGQREAHKGIFSKLNSIFTIKSLCYLKDLWEAF